MCGPFAVLPIIDVFVSIVCCILQLIALPSSKWGYFTTRKYPAVRVQDERGYFGLWILCSTRKGSPEKCEYPDTAFEQPPNIATAGAISIVHLLLLVVFICLGIIRILQIIRYAPDFVLGTRRLCIVKVALAIFLVILSISVSILASVGEGRYHQYEVTKGWAFWIQIIIISLDIVLLLICAFVNIQYWQLNMSEPPPRDPSDEFPETFIAPDYNGSRPFREREDDYTDRIVYLKDASVQSCLDGSDGDVRENPIIETPRKKRNHETGSDLSEIKFNRNGATVISVNDYNSPHLNNSSQYGFIDPKNFRRY